MKSDDHSEHKHTLYGKSMKGPMGMVGSIYLIYKAKCLSVCLLSYARLHLWADPDKTLQGDPGGSFDGHGGSDVEPSPWGPRLWRSQFQKSCSGSCNRGVILFSMSS